MNRTMESMAPWATVAYGVDQNGEKAVAVGATRHRGRISFETLTAEAVSAAAAANPRAAVACALPPGRAMAVWLQTPLPSVAKARRVLPTLLDMAMPFALEDCFYAFSPLLKPSGGHRLPLAPEGSGLAALAVAVRRDDVVLQLAALAEKGLNPHILDHEGLALWTQALQEVPSTAPQAETDGLRAVVWVRGREALLALGAGTVFWSAHRIADTGGGALERTVRVQIDAAANGRYAQMPLTWLWGGGDSAACRTLRTRIEAVLPGSVSLNLPHGEMFLARALATRALTAGPMRFNLRGEALAHSGTLLNIGTRQRRQAAGCAAMAGALLAINTIFDYSQSRQTDRAETRFTEGVSRVAGWPVPAKGENALLIAARELATRQSAWEPVKRAFTPSLLETLNTVLSTAAKEQVVIHALRLRPDALVLQGDAPSQAAADMLTRRYKEAGFETALQAVQGAPEGRFGFRMERAAAKEQP